MKHNAMTTNTISTAATLSPAAIAYLLRNRPVAAERIRVGSQGPSIQLLRAA